MLIKNVKVFTKDKSFKITDIATAGVRITECSGDEQVLDAKGLIAIPGLIEIFRCQILRYLAPVF